MTWLTQLLDYLFCWVPRLWFVQSDEAGVRITLGNRVSDCPPGWYVEWPLIHTVIKVNTAMQGVRFAIQSVTTADDVDLAIRGAVLYRISNARKAIFETADFDESLEAITGGVIEQYVAKKTYVELSDREALKDEIKKGIREEAAGWGIRLMRVYIPDIGRVRNIRVLSDQTGSLVPVSE
jgi:regulator of protease activity HflC (stomatin/prohibitin superfamily)